MSILRLMQAQREWRGLPVTPAEPVGAQILVCGTLGVPTFGGMLDPQVACPHTLCAS